MSIDVISKSIVSVKLFTEIIEGKVQRDGSTYLEALTMYAEDNNIEIESIATLVKSSHLLKAKLAAESEDTFLLKPTGAKLPL